MDEAAERTVVAESGLLPWCPFFDAGKDVSPSGRSKCELDGGLCDGYSCRRVNEAE
jgi:hypothetical protein